MFVGGEWTLQDFIGRTLEHGDYSRMLAETFSPMLSVSSLTSLGYSALGRSATPQAQSDVIEALNFNPLEMFNSQSMPFPYARRPEFRILEGGAQHFGATWDFCCTQ